MIDIFTIQNHSSMVILIVFYIPLLACIFWFLLFLQRCLLQVVIFSYYSRFQKKIPFKIKFFFILYEWLIFNKCYGLFIYLKKTQQILFFVQSFIIVYCATYEITFRAQNINRNKKKNFYFIEKFKLFFFFFFLRGFLLYKLY